MTIRSRRRPAGSRTQIGRLIAISVLAAAVVGWLGYKVRASRMPWQTTPPLNDSAITSASIAHVEDLIVDAEPIHCAPWDIGTGVAGYVWRAESPRGVVLFQAGWGDYAERNVQDSAGLFTHLLANGFSVYAFDMWGSGRSPGPRTITGADHAIRDHLTARAAIAGSRDGGLPLYLAGHSFGGLVTISSALDNPEGIAGVILLAPGVKYVASEPLLAFARLAGFFAPTAKLAAVPAAAVADGTEGITRDRVALAKLENDPRIVTGARMNMLTAGTAGTRSARNWSRYQELTMPLLVIHGTADTSTDPDGSVELVAAASSADKQLILIPDARHDLLDDLDATEVRTDVLAWLTAHTS
ncbi:alpha/beta fold hydrolase [Microbacterium pumilum]|uniref:Alpha/beta hydrolase n=1 Tax=Microbacterium pumilum TaxID=344165 RepID=A0ABP5EJI9_9MICO